MSTNEGPVSDEQRLSALLDGELSAEEAERLRQRLQREPELAARLAVLRAADDALRSAMRAGDDDPLPEGVLALLRQDARAQERAPDEGNVSRLADRRPPAGPGRLPLAMAASVALAVGFLLSQLWQLTRSDAPVGVVPLVASAVVAPDSPLHAPISDLASGDTRTLDGTAVTPRLSFRSIEGELCRLVDLRHQQRLTQAVVCRDGADWRVDLAGFAAAPAAADGGLFQPATAGRDAVDRALDTMMDGEPMGRDEELGVLARDWTD